MRVLHAIEGVQTGGTRTHIIQLATFAQRAEVGLVYRSPGLLSEQLSRLGVTLFKIPEEESWVTTQESIRGVISSYQPDVVHAHDIFGYVEVGLAVKGIELARVHTVHSLPRANSKVYDWPRERLSIEHALHKRATKIIAVSEKIAGEVVEAGVDTNKVVVIGNSVSPDVGVLGTQWREQLGLTEKDVIVGCVGRLKPEKNHRLMIESLPLVIGQVPEVKVVFVGDGYLRRELEKLVIEMELGPWVVFAGYRPDARELCAQFEVMVSTSMFEGSPIAILEAMYNAVPVIVTDSPGQADLIQNGITGLVVPSEPARVGSAIVHLLTDMRFRRFLGSNGAAYVREHALVGKMVSETERQYAEVLRGSRDQRT